jgi:hypothetical protein
MGAVQFGTCRWNGGALLINLLYSYSLQLGMAIPGFLPFCRQKPLRKTCSTFFNVSLYVPDSQPSVPAVRCPTHICPNSQFAKQLMNAIKAEMALFAMQQWQAGHVHMDRPCSYSYLLTVPPTSVEAERAFSAAGIFNMKLRSRLKDKFTDKLCFRRPSFYARKRQRQQQD